MFLAIAFALGFAARQVGLPPLVGFLAAGFALKGLGFESSPMLAQFADLGVTLLLFSIGLKLKIETLLKPEVWAGASLHMMATIVVFGLAIFALAAAGLHLFAELDLATSALVAFALSFSSTVFAVKALEEKGEMQAMHGRVAIGILIMQDISAVVFITISTGKVPSLWALALFGLILLRPLLFMIMDRCGHGELIPLFGLVAALVLGAEAFDQVGLKADLGALVLGVLLAKHGRAGEISDSLLSFKDLFLVGFFLTIGLSGSLSLEAVLVAVLFVLVLPLKVALFFVLLTRFRLRARSSTLAALSLATYSEFGLIVGAIGVANGWLTADWLAVIAVALAATFALGAPLNAMAHGLYARFHDRLIPWESADRHPDDLPIHVGEARIAILGMGRIGTGAYDTMRARFGDIVIGLDSDPDKVAAHREAGREVILGDATDSDFWQRVQPNKILLVMLTLPQLSANLNMVRRLADGPYDGRITAVARFPDEVEILAEAGVHLAVDSFAEAGAGIAEHAQQQFAAELAGLDARDE
ncbi:MAG: cation:proton antiporter domain-containing protein [Alphaproteobacteria bacterium]